MFYKSHKFRVLNTFQPTESHVKTHNSSIKMHAAEVFITKSATFDCTESANKRHSRTAMFSANGAQTRLIEHIINHFYKATQY